MQIDQNPEVLPHNPGIGQRISPDDDVPGDIVDRRIVRVTATLSQAIQGVPVYFRNFDLDDPADDQTIDPKGTLGDDNNGTPMTGQLLMANGCGAGGASISCPTNAGGVATIDFVVTSQPGDNFAIAANTIAEQANAVNVGGIELTNGGGQVIPTNCTTELVCRSVMLTVWRRLHIEVDSMGASTGNHVLGNIAVGTKTNRFETKTVSVNAASPLEINRFAGGRMTVGAPSLTVSANTANTVTVR